MDLSLKRVWLLLYDVEIVVVKSDDKSAGSVLLINTGHR